MGDKKLKITLQTSQTFITVEISFQQSRSSAFSFVMEVLGRRASGFWIQWDFLTPATPQRGSSPLLVSWVWEQSRWGQSLCRKSPQPETDRSTRGGWADGGLASWPQAWLHPGLWSPAPCPVQPKLHSQPYPSPIKWAADAGSPCLPFLALQGVPGLWVPCAQACGYHGMMSGPPSSAPAIL